jgi:putative membrane protein
MTQDAVLAYLHLAAILSWVVFISSTAALARNEWLNAAVVNRLVVVDRIAFIAGGVVLATGLARWALGAKGAAWYAQQPLLWFKVVLFLAMAAAALRTRRELRSWQRQLHLAGALPPPDAVVALRRRVMRASHLMLVLPAAAVLLARGIWTI